MTADHDLAPTKAAPGRSLCLDALILNSSRDCILVLDLAGIIQFAAPGAVAAMEVADAEAILGLPWLDLWTGQGRRAAVAAIAAAHTHGVGRFQGFCQTHQGTQKWWDVMISPVSGPDGGVETLVTVGRDITDLKQAERQLALSEERLSQALGASEMVGIWDWHLKADVIYADANFARFFAVDPAHAERGAPSADFMKSLFPEDLPARQADLNRVLADGGLLDREYRVRQADGSVRWILTSGRLIRDADGSPNRLSGTSVDVTDRRQANEALAEESRTLETLNRTGAALAGELDLHRVVQMVTDAGREMTAASFGAFFYNAVNEAGEAYQLYTLSGAPPEAFTHFPMPRITALFEPTFHGKNVVRSDDILADDRYGRDAPHHGMPKGHLPVRSYLGVPVVSRSGEVLGGLLFGHSEPNRFSERHERLMLGIAPHAAVAIDNARLYQAAQHELAEKRRAEEELRELNETLAQRIAAALAEREEIEQTLRQSQKMEAVGQLTGGLAHDFNNLLTGITGSLELMQTRVAQGRIGELDRYITAADGAARRAAALTHRLLAFSRRQTLDPKPSDLNRLVTGMEDLVRRTMGPQVSVEVVGAVGLWSCLVDPNQLENALLNLCINARDAMPNGGWLTIETGNRWLDERAARDRDLPPGQYVSLSVSDSGSGMTEEVIKRAFDPFFTTKPIGQGTGLGLSMIYGFARQSGGQARLYSELGKGTMVSLYLPRLIGEGEQADVPPEPLVLPLRQGKTILVVDDEPSVRMLVTDVLEDLGYIAVEAADGATGLQILQSDRRIDLLVSDVGLPGGMNGRQMADAARLARPGLKVLFITGYAENAVLSHGHLDPGMHVLTKPFSMLALGNRIKTLISEA